MARFNEILAARYNRALQKLLSMKGGPPSPQLASEFVPSFAFFWGREMRYLESWNSCAGFNTVPAVAANLSTVRLRNPTGSGIIAIIEKIAYFLNIAAATTSGLTLTLERPALLPNFIVNTNGFILDARSVPLPPATGFPVCPLEGKNNNAGTPGNPIGSFQGSNTIHNDIVFTDIQELPLLPGDSVDLTVNNVNIGLNCTFWWRERAMEPSEFSLTG